GGYYYDTENFVCLVVLNNLATSPKTHQNNNFAQRQQPSPFHAMENFWWPLPNVAALFGVSCKQEEVVSNMSREPENLYCRLAGRPHMGQLSKLSMAYKEAKGCV